MAYEWFPRLGDVPELDYEPLLEVDRRALPGHQLEAQVEHHEPLYSRSEAEAQGLGAWAAEPRESVTWGSGNDEYGGSQSPASQHARQYQEPENEAPAETLQRVVEAVELPGSRSDYHFLMMHAWGALWKERHQDPRAYRWIEELCQVDLRLLALGPELVFAESHWDDREKGFPVQPAANQLIQLYEREGFVQEIERV